MEPLLVDNQLTWLILKVYTTPVAARQLSRRESRDQVEIKVGDRVVDPLVEYRL